MEIFKLQKLSLRATCLHTRLTELFLNLVAKAKQSSKENEKECVIVNSERTKGDDYFFALKNLISRTLTKIIYNKIVEKTFCGSRSPLNVQIGIHSNIVFISTVFMYLTSRIYLT